MLVKIHIHLYNKGLHIKTRQRRLFVYYYLRMEENKSLEQIIADNLVYYRKAAGYTQLEIAERFNYSDKSISKWERAEGMPDVIILKSLADLYGIRVDDFYKEEKRRLPMSKTSKHWFIFGLTETLLYLVFGIAFVVLSLALPQAFKWWLIFVYAFCGSTILAVIWAGIWHKKFYQLLATSGIIWTTIVCVFLTLLFTTSLPNLWLLFLIGVPLQGLAVLWYFLKKINKKQKIARLLT